MTTWVSVLVVALFAMNAGAQSRPTDFSGHWVLVVPDSSHLETLAMTAAPELFVTQTSKAITVAHPSEPGTHPEAGTFEFGTRGVVGGLPGKAARRETQSVMFIGTQLMISRSTSDLDASGIRASAAVGASWLLDNQGRLVIEFREERSKERPKVATRVYVRKR